MGYPCVERTTMAMAKPRRACRDDELMSALRVERDGPVAASGSTGPRSATPSTAR